MSPYQRYFSGPPPKRARRGKPRRGGYRGAGQQFTPTESGFRYFKQSFMENPWKELEKSVDARKKYEQRQAMENTVPWIEDRIGTLKEIEVPENEEEKITIAKE